MNDPKAERWLAGCTGLATVGGVTIGEFQKVDEKSHVKFVAKEGTRGELTWGNPWNRYSVSVGEIRFADGTVGDPYANVMYHHTYIKIKCVRIARREA